ncbi:MAG TPA: hypothetical protein PKV33_05405 [Methanothrix sp.]|nr:hypothetical protein [Methanothrix sp.]
MLKPHNTLEEAILARHVVWMNQRKTRNEYWNWCCMHSRAFASIAIFSSRSRYAIVELDLYGLGAGGMDERTGREILRIVLEQPLKAGSFFSVSPVYVSACVRESSAVALVGRLRRCAQEALSLDQITHEEWLSGELNRSDLGGSKRSAFSPISGIVKPDVIEAILS